MLPLVFEPKDLLNKIITDYQLSYKWYRIMFCICSIYSIMLKSEAPETSIFSKAWDGGFTSLALGPGLSLGCCWYLYLQCCLMLGLVGWMVVVVLVDS